MTFFIFREWHIQKNGRLRICAKPPVGYFFSRAAGQMFATLIMSANTPAAVTSAPAP